jgi:hypothetical protein
MSKISIFKNFTDFVDNTSVDQIIKVISSDTLKIDITNLRQLIAEDQKVEAEKLKKSLHAFTASGTFDKGRKANLIQTYSQLIILDLDKIASGKLEPAFKQAASLPTTMCCFHSPGGNGLKILVKVSSTVDLHELAFNQLANHYEDQLQLPVDHSGKDVSRLCFFSYDPDLYYNPESQVFQVVEQDQFIIADDLPSDPVNMSDSELMYRRAVEFTRNKNQFINGNRNNFIFSLACNCNRNGIPKSEALSNILQEFNYNEAEIKSAINSAYNKNVHEFGKFAKVAKVAKVAKIVTPLENDSDQNEELTTQLLNTPFLPDKYSVIFQTFY